MMNTPQQQQPQQQQQQQVPPPRGYSPHPPPPPQSMYPPHPHHPQHAQHAHPHGMGAGGPVQGNPFISFVSGVHGPYPPHPHPHPHAHAHAHYPFPYGFPVPQDIDPSRPPMPPPQLPPGNEAFQNFLQQASFLGQQQMMPQIPLTVRSGVYDLQAVEAHMANSLKQGTKLESSPQPLTVQPPPFGSFSSNSVPNSASATPDSGVVKDDPTTYWLEGSSNEFAQSDKSTASSSTSARQSRRSRSQNNNNNNNNTNTSPTTQTNGNNEAHAESDDITVSSPTSNGHYRNGRGRNGYGQTSTVTSTDFTRNNNKTRGIHTGRSNTLKRYVPKPNDETFKQQKDTAISDLAKILETDTVSSPESAPSTGRLPELEDTLLATTLEGQQPQRVQSPQQQQQKKAKPVFALPKKEFVELISIDGRSIFEMLQPPLSDLHTKIAFLSRLQRIVENQWPTFNAKLHMFGSSANEMCFRNGDIDMCLVIDKGAGSEKNIVNKLSNVLERKGMTNVLALPHARVPIVKFKDPKSRFQCDICINNELALQNTRLVADYSKIDPRVRPLAYLVKYWAKRRGINNPYEGTLSSYAYVNLVINFLQTREPPILPSLQNLAAEEAVRHIVDKYDCTYSPSAPYIGFGQANTQSMAELLCQFFHYYVNEFDQRNCVVSVRKGTVLQKKDKGWDAPRLQRDYMLLCIEDPFETTHNLGRLVDKGGLNMIQAELKRACSLLRNEGSFVSVCKEKGV